MNEIEKVIKERRSIRSFKSEMPKKEEIEKIIEAGLYAPSGMGRQETKIIAITNKEFRDKLAKINGEIIGWNVDPFYGAPVVLIVLGNKEFFTSIYDGSLVLGNMMLMAKSLGLGSIWIHRAKEEFEMQEYKNVLKKLGIEGNWEGIGHCAIGYVDGNEPNAQARKADRVYWIE